MSLNSLLLNTNKSYSAIIALGGGGLYGKIATYGYHNGSLYVIKSDLDPSRSLGSSLEITSKAGYSFVCDGRMYFIAYSDVSGYSLFQIYNNGRSIALVLTFDSAEFIIGARDVIYKTSHTGIIGYKSNGDGATLIPNGFSISYSGAYTYLENVVSDYDFGSDKFLSYERDNRTPTGWKLVGVDRVTGVTSMIKDFGQLIYGVTGRKGYGKSITQYGSTGYTQYYERFDYITGSSLYNFTMDSLNYQGLGYSKGDDNIYIQESPLLLAKYNYVTGNAALAYTNVSSEARAIQLLGDSGLIARSSSNSGIVILDVFDSSTDPLTRLSTLNISSVSPLYPPGVLILNNIK